MLPIFTTMAHPRRAGRRAIILLRAGQAGILFACCDLMIAATALTVCPPYTHNDLYVGTLHRACKASGGIAALALALQMRPNSVSQMLQGKTRIPHTVFLTAVDILLRPAASRT